MPASSRSPAPDEVWDALVNVADEIEVAGDRTPDPDDHIDVDVGLDLDLDLNLDHLGPTLATSAQPEQPPESQQLQTDGGSGREREGQEGSGNVNRGEAPDATNGNGTGNTSGRRNCRANSQDSRTGSGNGKDHEHDEHRDHGTLKVFLSALLSSCAPWSQATRIRLISLAGLLAY